MTSRFEVTLAHKRSERLDVSKGVLIQPKLDGVRCYVKKDRFVEAYSRNHKLFKNARHITDTLAGIVRQNNVILDGELYNHELKDDFNKIISLVRKQKPTEADRAEAAKMMQYHIYDCYFINEPELNYVDRMEKLDKILYASGVDRDIIKRVITQFTVSNKKVEQIHINNKALGYEGSMLRGNVAYEQKRSHNLQKVKDWNDSEFTITGFIEGKGKFAKGLGKFLGFDADGREVEVPYPSCTMEERRKIWKARKSYIGKVATFEWFERTPGGAYRFPRFKGIRDYE